MVLLLFGCIFAVTVLGLLVVTERRAREMKAAEERLAGVVTSDVVTQAEAQLSVVRDPLLLSTLPWLDRLLVRADLGPRLAMLLYQADLKWSVGRLVLISIAAFIFGSWLINLRTHAFLPALVVGAFLGAAPFFYVRYKRYQRFNKMRQFLPEALDMMVAAIRAGHSLSSAMGMVARESPEPVRGEFRKCHDEQNFGLDMRTAMTNLIVRAPLRDIRVIVTAILIQKESGGNLTEILEKVGYLIREDFRLQRQIQVHTAQGRMTGWILSILPVVLGFGLYMVNPEHMSLLWHRSAGLKMLYAAIVMEIIGALIIRKIIRFDY